MQEYLGISVELGRKTRSGGNRRHSESHRSQRGAADAAGEKGFRRQNKFQNSDFTHPATRSMVYFLFGKIKGNLHICLILPKLMSKIPHPPSKVKTLTDPFTMFST